LIDHQICLDSLRGTPIRLAGPHVVFWWTGPTNPGRPKLSHKGIGVNTPTERLLPVVFRGFLPDNVWHCLAELSFFYRQLCAKELRKDVIRSLEENVAVLLCKMEKIFPPGFFNVMQHLIIHLPYEARLGGPILARWCYPYER